ncbi:MAG: PAS domain S-box protein [Patescibacteria group bacterium]|nr:PAS domain S-box protein [Patescibacteria group bacterium]
MDDQKGDVAGRKKLAWVVLAVLMIGVSVISWVVSDRLVAAGKSDLKNRAALVQQAIADNFKTLESEEVSALAALFYSSNYVSAKEFSIFYAYSGIQKNVPGLYAINFIRYVKQGQKADLEKEIDSQNYLGRTNLKIFPQTQNDHIAPIVYYEPATIGSAAFGLDVLSEPIRAAVINNAIKSGEFSLSDELLIVNPKVPGFVGYAPVYNKNIVASSTPLEKRSDIYGFVGMIFLKDGFFESFRKSISDLSSSDIDAEIYDGKIVASSTLLYDFNDQSRNYSIDPSLTVVLPLVLGGHDFSLVVGKPDGFISSSQEYEPLFILAIGSVISFLVFLILYFLANSYTRARELADSMTVKLKDSEEHYSSLFNKSKEAMAILSLDGKFISVNSAIVKMFGYASEKDFMSRPPFDYCSERQPDGSLSVEKIMEHIRLAIEKGEEEFEFLCKKMDGAEFWTAISMSRITTTTTTTFILLTIRNISEKKKYEEYIKETNFSLERSQVALMNVLGDIEKEKKKVESTVQDLNKFKLAVDNVSDNIIITDPDGVVLYANKAASMITGYSQEEIIGNRPSLWGNQMPKEFYVNFWKVIKDDKKAFIGDINNKRKNGETYIAEIKVGPILDHNGNVVFFVGVERDITRIKEVDRAKSEFVSVTSHQLRTPLTAVKWLVEILLRNKDNNLTKKQLDMLSEVYDGNERTLAIINDLLTLSRIESGKTSGVTLSEVDVVDFIKTTLKALEPLAKIKKVDLQLKIDLPAGYKIMLDKEKIIQSINNLISNAIKYSKPEGGVVLVTAESKNGEFVFSVKDDGIGIPMSAQHRIFERFFRADNAILSQTEGTGLGLPIVKEYINAHGGRVWFESEENKGTTFHFTLKEKYEPIKKSAETEPQNNAM